MSRTAPRPHEKTLRALRLFSGLAERDLNELSSKTHTRTFAAGETVFRAGDVATHVTVIQSGLVELHRALPDGREALLALFGPSESVGDDAVIARGPYPADAVVASAGASVLRIDAAPLLVAMDRDAALARQLRGAVLDGRESLGDQLGALGAGEVPQKLAALLVLLADRYGAAADGGSIAVPIALSRRETARLLGATVESVIDAMNLWQKASVVVTNAEGFVLRDAATLRREARARA